MRVHRGADANSDHHLLTATVRLKLRQTRVKNQRGQRIDIARLNSPEVKKGFVLALRNRFNILAATGEEDEIEKKWKNIKEAYVESAKNTIGLRKNKHQEWLTQETRTKIWEQRTLKINLLNTKSTRLQNQVQADCRAKDKEVKKSARQVKRAFIDKMADEAEQAAARGELSMVYKITKHLCGSSNNQGGQVKDKDGKTLTTTQEQAARRVQHFQDVLNQPEPDEPANPLPAGDDLEVDTSPPTEEEIRQAIKATKSRKAPGPDSVHTELLKADINTTTKVLADPKGQLAWNYSALDPQQDLLQGAPQEDRR